MEKRLTKPEWVKSQDLKISLGKLNLDGAQIVFDFDTNHLQSLRDQIEQHCETIARGSNGDAKIQMVVHYETELTNSWLRLDKVGLKPVATDADKKRLSTNLNPYHMGGIIIDDESAEYLKGNKMVPTALYLIGRQESVRVSICGEADDAHSKWLTPIQALSEVVDLIQYLTNPQAHAVPGLTQKLINDFNNNPPINVVNKIEVKKKVIDANSLTIPTVDEIIQYTQCHPHLTNKERRNILTQYGETGWDDEFLGIACIKFKAEDEEEVVFLITSSTYKE